MIILKIYKQHCLSFFLLFLLMLPAIMVGQTLDSGIRNYKQQDYERALEIFTSLDSPQAALFAGKSYYALRRFNEAEYILNDLLEEAPPRIYYEAAYTSALVDFQQKQYGLALNKLYRVFKSSNAESLAEDAKLLYRQILNYLTAEQRLRAIQTVQSNQIKFQLVATALGKVNYSSVQKLIDRFYESVDDGQWAEQMERLESSLSNKPAYKVEYGVDYQSFMPPDGTIYHIGIALPKVSTEKATFEVIRGLYLGAKLAAAQFNENHSNANVYISFLPTNSQDLDDVVEAFAHKNYGDLIIGPLFSEQAEEMVGLSAEYDIPIVAPLATAGLPSSGALLYQANSTFPIHGKVMARFAMNELEMNSFAVIAGRNTNGAKSAKAFREKVEELGGEVIYFFIKDFESSRYNISSYLKRIGSELQSVGAIYAPFTSQRAPFLIEQLTGYSNTLAEPITLLGSQKWGNINFASDIYSRSNIYYSVNSFRKGNSSDFRYQFRQRFNFRPGKYALIGYDVMRYLLQILDKTGNPALLSEAMQTAPFYRGLIKNIYFSDTHVNQAVQILKVGSGGRKVLQRH